MVNSRAHLEIHIGDKKWKALLISDEGKVISENALHSHEKPDSQYLQGVHDQIMSKKLIVNNGRYTLLPEEIFDSEKAREMHSAVMPLFPEELLWVQKPQNQPYNVLFSLDKSTSKLFDDYEIHHIVARWIQQLQNTDIQKPFMLIADGFLFYINNGLERTYFLPESSDETILYYILLTLKEHKKRRSDTEVLIYRPTGELPSIFEKYLPQVTRWDFITHFVKDPLPAHENNSRKV